MKKKVVDKKIIYIFFIILVLLGKYVRYSFMKEVLVDQGVGHSMIRIINDGSARFGLLSSASDTLISTSDNASKFFSIINMFNIRTYEGFEVYITILWNLLILFVLKRSKRKMTLAQVLFIMLSVVVLNIFDFCLAKEPLQMLFFVLIFGILTSKRLNDTKKFLYTLLILVLCTLFYRTYYILIAAFFVYSAFIFKFFTRKNKKVTIFEIFMISLSVVYIYFIVLNVTKLIAIPQYNELLRVRLRTSSAATDMRSLFGSTNLVIFSIDYLIMIMRMLFPIELMKLGLKYIPYVFYQLMITYVLFTNIKGIKTYKSDRKYAILLFIAFILGSATFEPDFGSWVRHETVLFPILLIILGLIDEKEKKDEE